MTCRSKTYSDVKSFQFLQIKEFKGFKTSMNQTIINTTNVQVPQDLTALEMWTKFYCLADVSDVVIIPVMIFQWIQCITAVTLGLYSILKHHLKQKSMNIYLRILSIIGTSLWMITAIVWTTNFYFYFDCNQQTYILGTVTERSLICTTGMGYITLDACFAIRLIKAFDDTFWEVSSFTRRFIYTTISLAALLGITGLVFFINGISTIQIGFLCFGVALTIYMFIAVLILILIISKTRNFLAFVGGSNEWKSNCKSNLNATQKIERDNNKCNNNNKKQLQQPISIATLQKKTIPCDYNKDCDDKLTQTKSNSRLRISKIRSVSLSQTIMITNSNANCDKDSQDNNKTAREELNKQAKTKNGDDDNCNGDDEDHDDEIVVVSLRDNPQMVMQLGNCNSNEIEHGDLNAHQSPEMTLPESSITHNSQLECKGKTGHTIEKELRMTKDTNKVNHSNSSKQIAKYAYRPNVGTNTDTSKKKLLRKQLFELIIRLIVIYAVTLGSTMMVIAMYVYLFFLFGNQDYGAVRQTSIFIRIVYLSETIISSMALTMQNKTAQPLYYRFCKCCHVVVEWCCLKCSGTSTSTITM